MFGFKRKLDDAGLLNLIAVSAACEVVRSEDERDSFNQNNVYSTAKRILGQERIGLTKEQERTLMLASGVLSASDHGVRIVAKSVRSKMSIDPAAGIAAVQDRLKSYGIFFQTK